jgi:hypothetical protein
VSNYLGPLVSLSCEYKTGLKPENLKSQETKKILLEMGLCLEQHPKMVIHRSNEQWDRILGVKIDSCSCGNLIIKETCVTEHRSKERTTL